MKKITKLTAAQKAAMPAYVEKWKAIGLSTTPINRAAHDKAVAEVYALAKLAVPRMIYTPCPLSGALAASVYAAIQQDSAVDSAVRLAVDSAVYSAVRLAAESAVGSAVRSAVRSAVSLKWQHWLWGNQWAGYASWAEFFMEECGVAVNRSCIDMMREGHYIWPFERVCFASEKPVAIHVDDQGRSHSAKGPAVVYGTGWGPHAWHGVVVPPAWTSGKPPTAAEALKQSNMELRRAACEIVGWHNILAQLNAKSIHKHPNVLVGELLEVEIPDVGKERFLRVLCGTKREFALPVPPTTKTADEAQRWLNWIPEDISNIPAVRT